MTDALTIVKHAVTNHWQATGYQCELPILAINQQDQILSSTIDLLVETEQGC